MIIGKIKMGGVINTVGLKIKEYLDQHGVKYSYLSRLTGIPMNLLSLTLNGKRRMSVEEYFTICKALDVSVDTFVPEDV
nr:helix-turn-helix transcriptional regulator [uncultured Mediterraneibacter sp.]